MMKRTIPAVLIPVLILLTSCGRESDSPKGCVTSFIIAVEEHDMSKAWGLLGQDAQSYFNTLGERQRRSGKGAFENEIDKIKTFRNLRKDYSIHKDRDVQDTIKMRVYGGREFRVNIADDDGDYKIKDEQSVRNILEVITGELKPEEKFY
jgi:hypothetical protein